jgi:hypothetical protein
MSGVVYVRINKQGTVRKLHATKWYRRLFLALWQAIGKKKHLQEVLDYLAK